MVRPILATCIAMGFYDRSKYDLSLLDKYQEHEKLHDKWQKKELFYLKTEIIFCHLIQQRIENIIDR